MRSTVATVITVSLTIARAVITVIQHLAGACRISLPSSGLVKIEDEFQV
jgi:hypothetical protein